MLLKREDKENRQVELTLRVEKGDWDAALAAAYDLSAFLRLPPELQRQRIARRNTPQAQEQFLTRWIPLEQRYFDALDPAGRCDILLEVES